MNDEVMGTGQMGDDPGCALGDQVPSESAFSERAGAGAPFGGRACGDVSPANQMRLQKFLARAGVASRRGAERLVEAGRVRVNGAVVAEMGFKVDSTHDEVEVDGKVVRREVPKVTLMLHKPLGFVTTMKDDHAKRIVSELVPTSDYPGLFPLGRLDRDTSGLLLFSTDGDLGFSVLRPRGHVTKSYVALVKGRPTKDELRKLREGVQLDDGMTLPATAELLGGKDEARARLALELPVPLERKVSRGCGRHAAKDFDDRRVQGGREKGMSREYAEARARKAASCAVVRLGIHEGRNRQVRRMLAAVGHPVVALHRESFGPLSLGGLPRGSWRLLSDAEIEALRAAVLKEDR